MQWGSTVHKTAEGAAVSERSELTNRHSVRERAAERSEVGK